MNSAAEVKEALRIAADPEKATFFPRFFKAGPGEYAEGDKFIGVSVPTQRMIVRRYRDLPLTEIKKLLTSHWHEERLTALLIMVSQYKRADTTGKQLLYDFYLAHTAWINNWDLCDASAEHIVGAWLDDKPTKMQVLLTLANSDSIWERRIAMLATFAYIKRGRADEAVLVAQTLLFDGQDLIQKAVGWMLREIGKRIDQGLLVAFLNQYAATMPRTTLRYAIEHFTPNVRRHYLQLPRQMREQV